jgi:hypothetical protein
MPRRATDWVEATAACVLVVLGLVAVVGTGPPRRAGGRSDAGAVTPAVTATEGFVNQPDRHGPLDDG